jgi:hypothetical protein
MLRACLAAALWFAAGCSSSDGTEVSLTFDQPNGLMPALTKFSATNGTATVGTTDKVIHFLASSSQGTLTMDVQGPVTAGQTVDLAQEHNFVSFDLPAGAGGWGSNGGMLAVDGLSPYRVRLVGVPMLKGAGTVAGSFVFDGSGTFK